MCKIKYCYTLFKHVLFPKIRFICSNFIPRSDGYFVSGNLPFYPWTDSNQDKRVEEMRLHTSWIKRGLVSLQEHDAHYIVSYVSFLLHLKKKKTLLPLS